MYQNSVYHTFAEFVAIWQNRGFIVKNKLVTFDLWHHKFCIYSVI